MTMAKKLLVSSTKHIQIGTRLTKQANQLRAIAKRSEMETPKLLKMAADLAEQGTKLKTYGAELRHQGTALTRMGLTMMRAGYLDQRGLKPVDIHPISLTTETGANSNPGMGRAHNTAFRSTKPSLQGMNLPRDSKSLAIGMTSQSQNIPEGLDIHPLQLSAEGKYFGHIKNQAATLRLNEIHEWHLWLTDPEGRPVTHAQVDIQGDMPGHVHGMPTRPRVVSEKAPGQYVIGGMKFQMRGWWVMTFRIKTQDYGEDRITYNILL